MKKIESISIQQLDNRQLVQNRLKSDILLSANLGFDDTLFKHPSRMDAFAAIFCVSGKAEVQVNLKNIPLKAEPWRSMYRKTSFKSTPAKT